MITYSLVELSIIGIIALVIAIIGVIAGFGGGVFLVPALILIFSIPAEIAAGTVLFALLFPSTVGAILAWRKKQIDIKFGILFAIPSAAGTFAGALILHLVQDITVVIIITLLILFMSIRMLIHGIRERKKDKNSNNHDTDNKNEESEESKSTLLTKITSIKPIYRYEKKGINYDISIPLVFIAGIIFGLLSGLLGISGGWLQTPLMILAFGLPPLVASGTSLFIIVVKALTGGITHIIQGNIDWAILILLAIIMPLGAVIGNWIKGKMKENHISLLISTVLLIILIFIIVSTAMNL